jgi:hypothetical protein
MTTVRQQRTASLVGLLNTSRPAGVPEFTRAVTQADLDPAAAPPEDLPAARITKLHDAIPEKTRDAGESRTNRASGLGGVLYRQLRLGVVLWFLKDGSTPPDDACEPTLSWIEKQIRAMKAAGLVHRAVFEEIGFTIEGNQRPVCRVTGVITLDYQCRVDDAEQWA